MVTRVTRLALACLLTLLVGGTIAAAPAQAAVLPDCAAGAACELGSVTSFAAPQPGSGPYGMAETPDGRIWFVEHGRGAIGVVNTNGTVQEFTLPLIRAGVHPTGIALGPDGRLWFTEHEGNAIGAITQNGVIQEYPLATAGRGPFQITAGPDGRMWFTEDSGNAVAAITMDGVITEYPMDSAGGAYPYGITLGADGRLWFTEWWYGWIGAITTDGQLTHYRVPNIDAFGITMGPDGRVWFADWNMDKIGAITLDGQYTLYDTPAGTAGQNPEPTWITTGDDGRLWFTEFTTGRIGAITTDGVVAEYQSAAADAQPLGMVQGRNGRLWFSQYNGNRVGYITMPSLTSSTSTVSEPVNAQTPASVTMTASGFGGPTTFSIEPSLPQGMSLDASTGIISGTPTAISAETSYRVTATDGSSKARATITITVTGQAAGQPTISRVAPGQTPNTAVITAQGTAPVPTASTWTIEQFTAADSSTPIQVIPTTTAVSANPTDVTVDLGSFPCSALAGCWFSASTSASEGFTSARSAVAPMVFPQVVTWAPSNTSAVLSAPGSLTPSSLAVSSTGSSITYSVADPGLTGCIVDGTTGVVAFTGYGTCTVTASGAGSATVSPAATSVTFSFTNPGSLTVPGAPRTVTATAASAPAAAHVSWLAPTSGASGIDRYEVSTAKTATGTYTAATGMCGAQPTGLSCDTAALTVGSTYFFKVRAHSAAGYGAWSTASAGFKVIGPALTPCLTAPASLVGGFTTSISNYDPAFTYNITTSAGKVAKGTAANGSLPLTVTGLASGATATVKVTASRTNYATGSSSVSGSAVVTASLVPTFANPSRTATTFTVMVSNYDPAFTYTIKASAGKVAKGTPTGSQLPITVSGLKAGSTVTVTVSTSRTGYPSGSASVSG